MAPVIRFIDTEQGRHLNLGDCVRAIEDPIVMRRCLNMMADGRINQKASPEECMRQAIVLALMILAGEDPRHVKSHAE